MSDRNAPLADAFGKPRTVRSAAHALAPQVHAKLAHTACPAYFSVAPDDTLAVRYAPNAVALCAWVAVGLLIDAQRGLRGRLGRCGAPDCGRFVVSFEGKTRRHCDDDHAEAFRRSTGAARVKRWRKKQELARRARAAQKGK
jgi:hypothetical protein